MKKNSDNNFTLDSKHNDYIKKFKKDKDDVDTQYKKLHDLEKKIKKLENDLDKNDENYELLFDLENEYKELKEEINKLENNKNEIDYYLKTNPILYNYYTFNEKIKNDEIDIDNFEEADIKKHNSINNFYQKNSISKVNKKDLLTQYLLITEPVSVITTAPEQKDNYCPDCNILMEININDGFAVCHECGNMETYIYNNDKPTYKENIPEVSFYSYKRLNHFQEYPQSVKNKIMSVCTIWLNILFL